MLFYSDSGLTHCYDVCTLSVLIGLQFMCCINSCLLKHRPTCKVTFIKYLHVHENLQTVCYRKQDVLIKFDFFCLINNNIYQDLGEA